MKKLIKRWAALALLLALFFTDVTVFKPQEAQAASLPGDIVSITRIPFVKLNGGSWNTEVFFFKDDTFPSTYLWYPNMTSTQKGNAWIASHTVAYCVEGNAVNPSGQTAAKKTTVAGSGLTSAQRNALMNILVNGYPANRDYWYAQGVTSYLQQAEATQLAIWAVASELGFSNLSTGFTYSSFTAASSSYDKMFTMYKKLYDCGKNTSTTTIKPTAQVSGTSVTVSGSNYVYKWNVKTTNCNWKTQLAFSTVPSGASVKVNGTAVSLSSGKYTTDLNNKTFTVEMTVPVSGNSKKTIELSATPYKPDNTQAKVVFYQYNNGYQDMVGGVLDITSADPGNASLTSPEASGKIVFYKFDDSNGHSPMTGDKQATFGVFTDAACTKPATVYSDAACTTVKANGHIVKAGYGVICQYLKFGTFYVKELEAPEDYIKSEAVTKVVLSASTPSVSVTYGNSKVSQYGGQIQITKNYDDSGDLITSDFVSIFGIFTDAACTQPAAVFTDPALTSINNEDGAHLLRINGDARTKTGGIGTIGYLAPGYYYVKELESSFQYELSSEVKSVNIYGGGVTSVQTQKVEFTNYRNYGGTLIIRKISSQNGAALAGAVFGVYSDEACTEPATVYRDIDMMEEVENGHIITTGADGTAKCEYLYPGTVFVKELKAPEGFALNEDPVEVFVDQGDPYSSGNETIYEVKDVPYSGKVSLIKGDADSGEQLSGAEFSLYEWSADTNSYSFLIRLLETVDDTGIYYTSDILYYSANNKGKFKIVETKAPDGHINTGWEEEFILEEADQVFDYYVLNEPTRYRFKKVDEAGLALSGCTFELKDSKGNLIDTWTTDESGIHELTGTLAVGETYTLTETAVPANYGVADSVTFIVTDDTDWVVVTVQNERMASVNVIKKDGEGNLLSGVVFALYSTKEEDSVETFEYGEKIYYRMASETTGTDGRVSFIGLTADPDIEYLLIEEKSAEGNTMLSVPIYIGALPQVIEEESVYDVTINIQNNARFLLPFTGGTGWDKWRLTIWILAASATAGMLLLSNKKKGVSTK